MDANGKLTISSSMKNTIEWHFAIDNIWYVCVLFHHWMSSTVIIIWLEIQFNFYIVVMSGALCIKSLTCNRHLKKNKLTLNKIGLEYYERLVESERKTSCEHAFLCFCIWSSPKSKVFTIFNFSKIPSPEKAPKNQIHSFIHSIYPFIHLKNIYF